MQVLRTFPGIVQVLGWDEAFMAVETDDPEAHAREVQRAVLEATDLWCSIGVGDSRHRAKLASAFAKPRGVFRLTREEWPTVMGPRPVEALWGIGSKTAAKLGELGIRTVDQLAAADDDVLATRFGPNTGPWIRSLGTGEDDGEVTAEPYVRRGQSHERTFQRDRRVREAHRPIFVDVAALQPRRGNQHQREQGADHEPCFGRRMLVCYSRLNRRVRQVRLPPAWLPQRPARVNAARNRGARPRARRAAPEAGWRPRA